MTISEVRRINQKATRAHWRNIKKIMNKQKADIEKIIKTFKNSEEISNNLSEEKLDYRDTMPHKVNLENSNTPWRPGLKIAGEP